MLKRLLSLVLLLSCTLLLSIPWRLLSLTLLLSIALAQPHACVQLLLRITCSWYPIDPTLCMDIFCVLLGTLVEILSFLFFSRRPPSNPDRPLFAL